MLLKHKPFKKSWTRMIMFYEEYLEADFIICMLRWVYVNFVSSSGDEIGIYVLSLKGFQKHPNSWDWLIKLPLNSLFRGAHNDHQKFRLRRKFRIN